MYYSSKLFSTSTRVRPREVKAWTCALPPVRSLASPRTLNRPKVPADDTTHEGKVQQSTFATVVRRLRHPCGENRGGRDFYCGTGPWERVLRCVFRGGSRPLSAAASGAMRGICLNVQTLSALLTSAQGSKCPMDVCHHARLLVELLTDLSPKSSMISALGP